jgi:ribosomal protein S27E
MVDKLRAQLRALKAPVLPCRKCGHDVARMEYPQFIAKCAACGARLALVPVAHAQVVTR